MSRRKPIKTKKCPRCNTPHSKRGTYCSYSCANVREQTEEIKKRKSETQRRFYNTTEEGEMLRKRVSEKMTTVHALRKNLSPMSTLPYQDTEYIIPPSFDDIFFVEDNDVWTLE